MAFPWDAGGVMLGVMRRACVLFVAALLICVQPSSASSTTPRFHGSVSTIDRATRRAMIGSSWHKGCPVPLRRLRLLHLNHWGIDGKVHRGEMIVRRAWARPVLTVFAALFRARFPMHKIALADLFGGDDQKLMRANVTSAFNCRPVEGHPGVWSEHAYGRAIDVNPVRNPYLSGDTVLPPAGERYLNRKKVRPGMVVGNGVVVKAFTAIGWGWGGRFHSLKDYMHFTATGR
jgi:hypothetical protein